MNKVAFYTLGCKVNQFETSAIKQLFIEKGYEEVEFEDVADVYVINTCTVTNLSDKKSRKMIRRAKSRNDDAVIIVTGCYSQMSPDEVASIEGVSLIIGTKERHKIIEFLNSYLVDKKQINMVSDIIKEENFEELKSSNFNNRARAFLKIQDGCDRFCTYCIIPYARGRVRSKRIEEVVAEAREYSKNGFKEVVLTGIHIASYGKDFGFEVSLIDAIERVSEIDGIERVRIGSVEPGLIDAKFLNRLAGIEKFCHHFHISLQSGSDEILKKMNRKYTTMEFMEKVNIIRDVFPDVGITTDVIIGFPGETEQDLEQTMAFVKAIEFSWIHVFKYSPRKGTPAARFDNQINESTKKLRNKRLTDLSKAMRNDFMQRFTGINEDVYFESELDGKTGWFEGHTGNFIKVQAKSSRNLSGIMAKVYLEKVQDGYISALII